MGKRAVLSTILVALGLGIATGLTTSAPGDPISLLENGGFEATAAPASPSSESVGSGVAGWLIPEPIAAGGYGIRVSRDDPHTGRQCAEIYSNPAAWRERPGLGSILQSFDATPFQDQTLRLGGWVRTEGAGQAQLWMRVNASSTTPTFFEYEPDQPIRASRWTRFEIVGPVARDAAGVQVGLNLIGQGSAFLDDVRLEIVGSTGHEPPSPISERGLENLVAAARLLDTLRFFHPSDSSVVAPWNRLGVTLVASAEPAPDPRTLSAVLSSFAAPLAPSAAIFAAGDDADREEALRRVADRFEPAPPRAAIQWNHYGVGYRDIGFSAHETVYRSWRGAIADADLSRYPEPLHAVTLDLGGGVEAIVPTAVYLDDEQRTLPRSIDSFADDGSVASELSLFSDDKPPGFLLSGNDRTTRLAAVIICWSILRQFYPFELADCPSWDDALRDALRRAALDPDREAFVWTLRRMISCLDDGHAAVFPFFAERPGTLPLQWRCLEDQLIVTEVAVVEDAQSPENRLLPGDSVVAIDGQGALAAIDSLGAFISSPTRRWRRYQASQWLRGGPVNAGRRLTIERGQTRFEVELPMLPARELEGRLPSQRQDPIRNVARGVIYVDLTRTDDATLEELLSANPETAVIFDLRGDLGRIGPGFLGHWIDRPILSPEWRVRLMHQPAGQGGWTRYDPRAEAETKTTRWALDPTPPRLSARVAFLSDERSMSRAETYLAFARFGLGAPVVGSPSAGTLGNANRAVLPGGFRILWTGMVVHHGSDREGEESVRLSGVGIAPTIPALPTVAGIRAGLDDALERAIEVVSAR